MRIFLGWLLITAGSGVVGWATFDALGVDPSNPFAFAPFGLLAAAGFVVFGFGVSVRLGRPRDAFEPDYADFAG